MNSTDQGQPGIIPGATVAEAAANVAEFAKALNRTTDDEMRDELADHDLPELSETPDEADARAAASRYLGAMRTVQAERGETKTSIRCLSRSSGNDRTNVKACSSARSIGCTKRCARCSGL